MSSALASAEVGSAVSGGAVTGGAAPGSHRTPIAARPGVTAPSHSKASTAPLSPHERSAAIKTVGGSATLPPAASGAGAVDGELKSRPNSELVSGAVDMEDEAAIATSPTIEDGPPPAVDEAAEAAFLGEARQRGEVVPRRSAEDADEDAAPKTLPPLDELVNKIPADVRDVLEDLFRARFVSVKRFPKKSLK